MKRPINLRISQHVIFLIMIKIKLVTQQAASSLVDFIHPRVAQFCIYNLLILIHAKKLEYNVCKHVLSRNILMDGSKPPK